MKRDPQPYKGYVIRADPFEIDPYHWTIGVVIERHHSGGVAEVRHEAQGTHLTEDKAIAPSLAFGRQIVDGKHPDLPLP